MSRAQRFVELWNEGRVEDALGDTTPDHTYSDPVLGGPLDRDAHLGVMRQVLQAMPDRHITVHRCWEADDAEFLEYTWRATDAGGHVVEHEYFAIFEFDDAGRACRQRHLAL